MIKKCFLTLLLSVPLLAMAQSDIQMADAMRQDGKIRVVFAVIAVILIGITAFLLIIDRKLSGIEKQIKKQV